MAIAMDCPHCGTNKVETVRNVWYLQGFLLFARYGSRSYVGCNRCTRSKTLQSFAISTLLGWWCFPWGIGTPFVILQNLTALAGNDDERALASLLRKQGLDIEDFRVDSSGRALGDRKLADGVLSVLHRMTWADGSADAREVAVGADIAAKMLGDLLDEGQAEAVLSQPTPPAPLEPGALSQDGQLMLMRAACAIAQADGIIEDAELAELRALGLQMGLAAEITEAFLAALASPEQAEDAQRKAQAAALLQVATDASPTEVRAAYQIRVAEAAQMVRADELAAHREALADAYQTMLSA